MDDNGNAVIAGFASATFDSQAGWNSSLRWLAPELYDSDSATATLQSDIYSFGMTALQVCNQRRQILFFRARLPFTYEDNDNERAVP